MLLFKFTKLTSKLFLNAFYKKIDFSQMMPNSFCSVGFGKWQTKKEFVAFQIKVKFRINSKLIFLPFLSPLQTTTFKFLKPCPHCTVSLQIFCSLLFSCYFSLASFSSAIFFCEITTFISRLSSFNEFYLFTMEFL